MENDFFKENYCSSCFNSSHILNKKLINVIRKKTLSRAITQLVQTAHRIQFPIKSIAMFPLMSLAQGQFLQRKAWSFQNQLKAQWRQNITPSFKVLVTKGIFLK